MIYVLGKADTFYDEEELEDVVYMASTKITDILDYLFNNVRTYQLRDYIILAFEEGKLDLGIIYTLEGAYESFVKYRPTIFLREENEEEFQNVSTALRSYCNKVEEAIRKAREEEAQKSRTYKEKQERELYEKLKAKYGE